MVQIATTGNAAEAAQATADGSIRTARAIIPHGPKPVPRLVELGRVVVSRNPVGFGFGWPASRCFKTSRS